MFTAIAPSVLSSAAPPATPLFWVAGFAVCFLLHLALHPQAEVFRAAARWLGRHRAPILLLWASLLLAEASSAGPLFGGSPSVASLGLDDWPQYALRAWRRLAMLFHGALVPPTLWRGSLAGLVFQAALSAAGQMWLCCYLVASQQSEPVRAFALRETFARWPVIMALALCHLPWWWAQKIGEGFARDWLLPEFFLVLAPLPLVAASQPMGFFKAGDVALGWWRESWVACLAYASVAFPLLTLLEFVLQALTTLPSAWRMFLGSAFVAVLHPWLFITAALLLLRGGYVRGGLSDD